MQRARTILKSTLTNYLRQTVQIVMFFFLTPYTARMLGTEAFGLWSLLWSTVGFLSLLDFGVSSSVVKFLADARGKADDGRIQRVLATFFWSQIFLGLVVMGAAAVFAPWLAAALAIPESLARPGQVVLLLLAGRVATGIPFALFGGVLVSYDRMATNNLLRSAGTILYAVMVVIAFQFSANVTTLALANLGAHLVANFVIIPVAMRRIPGVSLSIAYFDRRFLREIGSFSFYSFLIQASALLYTRVDAVVIQRALSLIAVAHYSVAMQTVSRAILFCRQLASALTPVVAKLKGENDAAAIRATLRKGTKLGTALAVGPIVGLIYLADPLIASWMGPEFLSAVVPLQILAAAAIVECAFSVPTDILTMTGHQRLTSLTTIWGQIFNLVMTIVLVMTPLKIVGVALATLLASLGAKNYLLFVGAPRLGYSGREIYVRSFAPSVFPAFVMVVAMATLERGWMAAFSTSALNLIGVFLVELIGCVVFFAVFWQIGLSSKERDYYRDRVGGILSIRK